MYHIDILHSFMNKLKHSIPDTSLYRSYSVIHTQLKRILIPNNALFIKGRTLYKIV